MDLDLFPSPSWDQPESQAALDCNPGSFPQKERQSLCVQRPSHKKLARVGDMSIAAW